MGGQNTKNQANIGYFGPADVLQLKALFHSISRAKNPNTCSPNDFQRHCERYLDDWLALKLAEKFTIKNPKGTDQIDFPNVILFLSSVLSGTVEEKVKSIFDMALFGSSETRISREEISQYAQTVIKSYLKCMETSAQYQSWNGSAKITSDSVLELSDFLLLDLFHKGVPAKDIIRSSCSTPEKCDYSVDDLCRCFSTSPLLLNLHSSVFSICFDYEKSQHVLSLIPYCLHAKKQLSPEEFTIQDLTQIIFLNSHLPSDARKEWRYLFSTTTDGESFSKMLGAIQNKGSTILIIKEDGGNTFGAFADESWSLGPKFFGSEKCFLFHLNPKLMHYSCTGFNQNFQYLNTQQQTMPNGIGIGGKLDYFGLWLDAEFGKGKCVPTCTTFVCPQLSSKEEYHIHTLEVWGVGPEPVKEEGQRDPKSVLDKDPEAKAILELMNRAPVSDGYRDKKKAFEENDED